MLVLIVAHTTDEVAGAVGAELRRRGIDVVVASPAQLCGGRLSYRSADGHVVWAADVAGTAVRSDRLGAVFNRAMAVEPTGFAGERNEAYAGSERAALFVAMLASLRCPVTNRPTGASLSGPAPRQIDWLIAAARLGLPVRGVRLSSDHSELEPVIEHAAMVSVVGDRAHATPGPAIGEATGRRCVALARRLGCRFLQVAFGSTPGRRFAVTHIESLPPSVTNDVVTLLADDLIDGRAGALTCGRTLSLVG